MEVDVKLLKSSGLLVEEFVFLSMVNDGTNPLDFSYLWTEGLVMGLAENMWIKIISAGEVTLRTKAKELFSLTSNEVNFDEFWDVFPITTPSGRVLRAAAKIWGDKPTRDYETCKKKYLSKIKTVDAHKQVVAIIKARVTSKDYEYMNNMETYINQHKWQQDVKYLTPSSTSGMVNRIVE